MAGPDSLQWLFSLIGVAGACAGGALVLWALFWDRPRGRKRCPKCWYDLTALPTSLCPECGHQARSARATARTRRRWRWAVVGVVACIAGYLTCCVPRIRHAGWPGAVPTTALIWGVGRYEPPEAYRNGAMSLPSAAAKELARRCAASGLWDWQWRMLVRDLRMVSARRHWPRGVPWQISVSNPSWLGGFGRMTVDVPEELAFVRTYPAEPRVMTTLVTAGSGLPVSTATLDPSVDRVTLRVSCGTWSGELALPVEQVGTPEEAMTPVRGPEIDAAVRRALHCGISKDRNSATGTDKMLGARLYRDKGPLPKELAIGLNVELLRDGAVVASWPLGLYESAFGEPVDWIRINMPEPGWNELDARDMGRWTVRVRGEVSKALGDFKRDKYWAGEYTVPLREFLLN